MKIPAAILNDFLEDVVLKVAGIVNSGLENNIKSFKISYKEQIHKALAEIEDCYKEKKEGAVRTYSTVCPSCSGSGWIDNPIRVSSSTQIVCLACNGSKVITVTEKLADFHKEGL